MGDKQNIDLLDKDTIEVASAEEGGCCGGSCHS